MTNLTENKYFKWFLGAVLLMLIMIAFSVTNCESNRVDKPIENTNPLNDIIDDKTIENKILLENNKVLRIKNDSLLAAKPKIVYRKTYVYDSLSIADTACINSLVTLYNQCAKVDSVNEFIISNQSNQIDNLVTVTNNQQDIIDIRNYQHGVDSVNYEALKEQLLFEFKRGKRKGRNEGILIGKAGEVIKDGLYLYLKR